MLIGHLDSPGKTLAGSPEFNECMQVYADYLHCMKEDFDRTVGSVDKTMESLYYLTWMGLKRNCFDGDNNACSGLSRLREEMTYGKRTVRWALCGEPNREQCIRRYVGKDYIGLP